MSRNIANILGVPINSTQLPSLLDQIEGLIEEKPGFEAKPPLIIFTPNPEFLVEAQKNLKFKEILKVADINIPDGFGLVLFSRVFRKEVKERVSGADLVSCLLETANSKGWSVGIAGARRGDRGEAEFLFKKLSEKYPRVKFVNLDNLEFKIENLSADRQDLKPAHPAGGLKIVFACHGMVKQEEWIIGNKEKINAKVFIGIGGSLDFLTGFSKRAPFLMRKIGLEWLWRGLTKPGHLKRVWTATVVFPWLIFREKFKINS
ncbi:WecB/TagA/CpsF family glycosyltransferase [Candidatus Microgenomates bacterium]|jgi:N-acetylglucosaminyldiphosphoundecaprenol N-acetyl-beta-D-mannosaminyltransferase|nr:MAG: WecB/TagA/CpsF family glycosyltransferase [Candidatus Microgenomates bacterium]